MSRNNGNSYRFYVSTHNNANRRFCLIHIQGSVNNNLICLFAQLNDGMFWKDIHSDHNRVSYFRMMSNGKEEIYVVVGKFPRSQKDDLCSKLKELISKVDMQNPRGVSIGLPDESAAIFLRHALWAYFHPKTQRARPTMSSPLLT